MTQLRTASSQLDTGRSALTASQAELAVLKKEVEALSQERVSATRAAEAARKNAKDVRRCLSWLLKKRGEDSQNSTQVDGSLAKAHGWSIYLSRWSFLV